MVRSTLSETSGVDGGLEELQPGLKILADGGKPKQQDLLRELVEGVIKTAEFEYIAEGRANAVFKVNSAPGIDHLAGWLLRVPKQVEGATPHSYEELQKYRETVVEPRVGTKHLVPQLMVSVPAEGTRAMNEQRELRSRRKEPSSSIAAGFAMLIQDMNPRAGHGDLGLEFKPKWLAQSPIAPGDAVRCRTCAREAWRNHEKQAEGKSTKTPVCPIGLVDPDPAHVLYTVELLAPDWSPSEQHRLRDAFSGSGIFQKLRDLQVRGDPGDTMFTNPQSEGFGLAMTLRDCTCFVRMSRTGEGEVEIKLADVDRKNWESKAEYWQHSHTNLVDNGYYHGTESPRMATKCVLERTAA
ncbi:inositol-pentakisphosphate 2-kinase-domain-containing protein [Truncatella angustata]|uniref:Inositol-pentakisphosphate 2-kinase n=1 Tax=Truncatella angustata TaxID=152316 RepID=A0A9P8UKJ6_9PEZI|nr:inositol-pentakisphosphate 2-kinase-domain-containing protein [Truncatella angustata]KAH6653876.1 inositol-pentakisphosphate 2-kinase-domain-containing protein [Truncatella angustata]KAH8196626.1 hypothetical protein TruAng_009220 [Truncatella angustata]